MSITHVANRGTNSTKTTGGTIGVNPTVAIAANKFVACWFVGDNLGTTAGETAHASCADTKGNTWVKVREETATAGSSIDGCTVALWASYLTTGLGTGDTVTVTHPSVPARAIGLEEHNIDGTGFSVAGDNGANGTGTSPTVTLSGLTSALYFWLGFVGWERYEGDFDTEDTDYTGFDTDIGTTGGGPTGNVGAHVGYRSFTGTSDTYAPTIVSADYAICLGAIEETGVAAATAPPPRRQTNRFWNQWRL